MDTIFAEATAPGRAGVSVIRISGPRAHEVAEGLMSSLPKVRQSAVRMICDTDGDFIDQALVLRFDGPESFTGEDVVEFHLHGSIAIMRRVVAVLSGFADLRLADPGEFTRRALENGRLDLVQVEGLGDLIEAETEMQRRQALRVLSGDLGNRVEDWRRDLIRAAALLEATIDFADEDVPFDVSGEVRELLARVNNDLSIEIAGTKVAERIRAGFEVAIIGAPNVGKSTLLNRLAGRDAALTSNIAGTTRDVIEVRMDLAGVPVTLLDTAGIREGQDEIEILGIDLARRRAESADLRIFLLNQGDEPPLPVQMDDVILSAKGDLMDLPFPAISGHTGAGISELLGVLQEIFLKRVGGAGLATHARHAEAMRKSSAGIATSIGLLEQGPDGYDLVAAELRLAVNALEVLLGRIDAENMLDEIFASFCLGK
ncbi:tRNA uridine-5-carboxymethylaminomethyl(34) synthesis GTPase MnmE [Sulfitobacter albidus]|uniref:tRNA modification GTPase MnmE n=1 Tax=Sulfitobacter albidus TaxID=2829501 RepID=A0A975JDD1_9RHOB|nr:tRNA uridine-5-carboxymethylaminomethyl(34) synthesis GTPase MnmE [Sulfitobacter albidus]QUJ76181.1 tRNA uridine-5-carboxymethylaminomethyl(34) synthesis GTPase MnmE [Sulfitobacter albidus]